MSGIPLDENMTTPKRTVLVTGCSDGGTGAALAQEFHRAGLHVYATARDPSKMQSLTALGIETLPLDVQSESSIQDCVTKIPSLDILVNNAGAMYTSPISDLSIPKAKELFDINVWGYIAVTQAFLPLLLRSPKAIVVNHTSCGAGMTIPFQAAYNASKAAMSSFNNGLRIELQPFDNISVVELRTGGVRTNIARNVQTQQPKLPNSSVYAPARELVEKALRYEWFEGMGIPAEQWAQQVVADLLKERPPAAIWRGESARSAWIGTFFPLSWFDGMLKKMTGLDKIESVLRNH